MSNTQGESVIITAVGEQYSSVATVLGRTALPVFAGSREEKYVLDVQLETKSEPLSLIERPLHSGMIATWLAFRDAGLPVAPELFTRPGNTVFVADVKADGSEVFGKYLRCTLQQDMPRERPRPKIDEYVSKADNASLVLPKDDPFELIIHPNGEWDLITLDLTNAKIPTKGHSHKLSSDNISTALSFDTNLSLIREHLTRQGVVGRKPAKSKWRSTFLYRKYYLG